MSAAERAYAQALFETAAAKNKLAVVSEELELLEPLIRTHRNFFFNPGLPSEHQVRVLHDCLDGQADRLTTLFLTLLCARRRLKLLPRVRKQFDMLCAEALERRTVLLRIPYEPDETLLARLRDALGDLGLYSPAHKDMVSFETVIDGGLLGGFVAEYRGRILDASVRTQLAKLIRNS